MENTKTMLMLFALLFLSVGFILLLLAIVGSYFMKNMFWYALIKEMGVFLMCIGVTLGIIAVVFLSSDRTSQLSSGVWIAPAVMMIVLLLGLWSWLPFISKDKFGTKSVNKTDTIISVDDISWGLVRNTLFSEGLWWGQYFIILKSDSKREKEKPFIVTKAFYKANAELLQKGKTLRFTVLPFSRYILKVEKVQNK